MKVALIQLASTPNISDDLKRIEKYLQEAEKQQVELAIFPEEFLTLALSQAEKIAMAERLGKGELQSILSGFAMKYNIAIVAGTLPIATPEDHIAYSRQYYSSSLLFDTRGQQVAHYHKIHLFDVNISSANESYHESEHVLPGEQLMTYAQFEKHPGVNLGFSICYDIRFPEMYRRMAMQGVNIFLVPSAFTIPTGQKHWEILLRARAIENLSFVLACNNVGVRQSGEGTYGHSMIISPWGEVLSRLSDREDMIVQKLDVKETQKLRSEFPVLEHTRMLK
jgi:predicted amidohydrolase